MSIDDIVEMLSASLFDNYYKQTFKSLTYSLCEGYQSVTVEDLEGNTFLVEVRKL